MRPKSLLLFGHCVLRSFVFIHIPASNVIYLLFARLPEVGQGGDGTASGVDTAGGDHFVRADARQSRLALAEYETTSFFFSPPLLATDLFQRTTTFIFINIVAFTT